MIRILFLFAAVAMAAPSVQAEVKSEAPRLTPGYPPRSLFLTEYEGKLVKVWGWKDTEGLVHFIPAENPHLQVPSATPAAVDYGVQLAKSKFAAGAGLITNDREFGQRFFDLQPQTQSGAPCPSPRGPDREPRLPDLPVSPLVTYERHIALAVVALAVGLAGWTLYRRRLA